MYILRTLQILLLFGLATGAVAQDVEAPKAVPVEEPKEEPKPKTRRFFLFKRDSKKEEEPKPEPAKPETPLPDPPKEEPKKEDPEKEEPKKKEEPKPKAEPKPSPPASIPAKEKAEPKPELPKAKSEPKPEPKPEPPKPKPSEPAPSPPPAPPKEKPPENPQAKPVPMEPKTPAPPAPPAPTPEAEAPKPPVDPAQAKRDAVVAQVHSAIRTAAQQVEKVRKRRGEEAGGIAAKVESILTAPEPSRPHFTSRVDHALSTLRRPTATFEFASKIHTGGRGFSFDDSRDGRQLLIEELYRVKTDGTREVERLLQLRRLSGRQGRSDIGTAMSDRSILAARTQLAQKPQDANAHALLAEALASDGEEARKEMLQEIETALRLEPDHPRALVVKLEDQVARLREYLLREGPRGLHLPPRDPREVMRRLYARAPSDEALQAHETAATEIRTLAARVMDRASAKPELMLRACAALILPPLDVELAELARSGKARSFEQFESMAAKLELSGARARMEKVNWRTQLQRVVDAAGDDGQMIAVVSAIPILWSTENTGNSSEETWAAIPEKYRQMFERGMDRAAEIGDKDDSVAAAKACEAVACLEFAAAGLGAKVRHEGLALRAISLDPWRVHALDLLTANLSGAFPAAAHALAEIRLAALEGCSSHTRCAAAAERAGNWAAAERHLDACLKTHPDNLEAMSYLIAIRLSQDQTPERLSEVQKRFDAARAVFSAQQETLSPKVAEDFIVNYVVFLCLREDLKSAAETFAISTSSGRFSPATAKEVAILIQSQ